jgi:hypothetical protein
MLLTTIVWRMETQLYPVTFLLTLWYKQLSGETNVSQIIVARAIKYETLALHQGYKPCMYYVKWMSIYTQNKRAAPQAGALLLPALDSAMNLLRA